MPSNHKSRDPISVIATVGAPLVSGLFLIYSVVNGHWTSVVFTGLVFAAILVIELIYVGPWTDQLEEPDEDGEA